MKDISALMAAALTLMKRYGEFYLISRRDRTVWMAKETQQTITRNTMSALERRGLVEPSQTPRGRAMVLTQMGKRTAK